MGTACSVDSSRASSAESTKKLLPAGRGVHEVPTERNKRETKAGDFMRAGPSIDEVYGIFRGTVTAAFKPGMTYIQKLPENGAGQNEVMRMVEEYQTMRDETIGSGKASGTVYNGDDQLTEFNTKIYEKFVWYNPLHPDIFPDIVKMEAEVIQMCVNMFNGGPEACGTMTSGGTESNMLACKCYRDLAYSKGITRPEVILPKSAHASLVKACLTLNITPRYVEAEPISMKSDLKQIKSLINKNTCMMVGSAPSYPFGIIDYIEEMSTLALKYNIPLHVDCCLGGFLLPFMKAAGYNIPAFDFRLPGVTSISADTHKYGFTPKGTSVILYRSVKHRKPQFFAVTEWSGGLYVTGTFAGSRSGAAIAGCWATMLHFGLDGYIKSTKSIISVARYIRDGLKEIEGIFIFGDPLVSVVSVGSDKFDVFRLYDALSKKGWHFTCLQFPSGFHICCTMLHTQPGVADQLLSDIREITPPLLDTPSVPSLGMGAFYGATQTIPDRKMVGMYICAYQDAQYDSSLPPHLVTKTEQDSNNNTDINNNNETRDKETTLHNGGGHMKQNGTSVKSVRQPNGGVTSPHRDLTRAVSDLSTAERLINS